MAAAVIQANDALPAKDRRFQSVSVSERIDIPAWNSVQSAFKRAYLLSQQAEVAVRTFKSGKPSPIDTIRLALLKGQPATTDAQALIKVADGAMYAGKQAGKNTLQRGAAVPA